MTLQLKKSGSYAYLYAIKSFRKEDGRGPRSRRGRDSTDRCVPGRSPLTIRLQKRLSATTSKPQKTPNRQHSGLVQVVLR